MGEESIDMSFDDNSVTASKKRKKNKKNNNKDADESVQNDLTNGGTENESMDMSCDDSTTLSSKKKKKSKKLKAEHVSVEDETTNGMEDIQINPLTPSEG